MCDDDDEMNGVSRRPSNLDRDAKLSYQSHVLSKKRMKDKINRLNSSVYRGANASTREYDLSEPSVEDYVNSQEEFKLEEYNEIEKERTKKIKYQYTNDAYEVDETPQVESTIRVESKVKVKTRNVVDEVDHENHIKNDTKKSVQFEAILTPEPHANEPETNQEEEGLIDLSIFEYLNTDLKKFLLKPVPTGLTIKCLIYRQKGFYPEYKMCLQKDDGTIMSLMSAKKTRKTKSPTYLIRAHTCDQLSSGVEIPLGKLKSNLLGTQFTLYDMGRNPDDNETTSEPLRCEYFNVLYDVNVFGLKGPRQMTIIVPGINEETGEAKEIRPVSDAESIVSKWKTIENEMEAIRKNLKRQNSVKNLTEVDITLPRVEVSTQNLIKLENKKPQWNADLRSYALNFNGRVTVPSVKNFQIVHSQDIEYIIQQFGKVSQDVYTCDYSYPLCALQAFGIAITSLDNKLACD